jgi:hypothetical protein
MQRGEFRLGSTDGSLGLSVDEELIIVASGRA